MADRLVKVLENGRMVTRGIFRRGRGVEILLDREESLPVTIDWSGWLGTDAIASATNETSGPSLSNEANTTTQTSMTVSGASCGWFDNRITTAAGAVKELRVYVRNYSGMREKDYGR